jgi:PadR family transcriptional regulator, regulatory protein PadR
MTSFGTTPVPEIVIDVRKLICFGETEPLAHVSNARIPAELQRVPFPFYREPSQHRSPIPYCFPIGLVAHCCGKPIGMPDKQDVRQGTLALMVLKTLDSMGPQHGYGIARRIEQTSGDLLAINHGTLYPVLLKLEQDGAIAAEWGSSENNRRAKFYKLTRAGRKQLQREARVWQATTEIMARFLAPGGENA